MRIKHCISKTSASLSFTYADNPVLSSSVLISKSLTFSTITVHSVYFPYSEITGAPQAAAKLGVVSFKPMFPNGVHHFQEKSSLPNVSLCTPEIAHSFLKPGCHGIASLRHLTPGPLCLGWRFPLLLREIGFPPIPAPTVSHSAEPYRAARLF